MFLYSLVGQSNKNQPTMKLERWQTFLLCFVVSIMPTSISLNNLLTTQAPFFYSHLCFPHVWYTLYLLTCNRFSHVCLSSQLFYISLCSMQPNKTAQLHTLFGNGSRSDQQCVHNTAVVWIHKLSLHFHRHSYIFSKDRKIPKIR